MSYFSHQDPNNPESHINFTMAQMEIQRWTLLISNPEADASTLVMELKTVTGNPSILSTRLLTPCGL